MKHAGKARQAGIKILLSSLMVAIAIVALWSFFAGRFVAGAGIGLAALWGLFAIFSLSFFRDPDASVPSDQKTLVSPAHGTVDVIDELVEKSFMGGRCKRISIFLSVFDVHVQNAPVSGRMAYLKHSAGKFVNAMRSDCGDYNENVLLGFETDGASVERVGVRLIAGLLARRIVPWVTEGETVVKGERISLIQFGSRVDLFIPPDAQVQVKLGDKVKGGETVMALRK